MPNNFKYPRGSEWRKWDLHVHSPLSGLNNQYPKKSDETPDWDQFINMVEKKDVSVLGITDYFSIDGYRAILDFRKEGKLNNFDLILPNVELRLDTFVVETKSKEINLILPQNNGHTKRLGYYNTRLGGVYGFREKKEL